jgi:hypothetical protein
LCRVGWGDAVLSDDCGAFIDRRAHRRIHRIPILSMMLRAGPKNGARRQSTAGVILSIQRAKSRQTARFESVGRL